MCGIFLISDSWKNENEYNKIIETTHMFNKT